MEADGSVLCVVWSLTNLQPPLLTFFFFILETLSGLKPKSWKAGLHIAR